MKKTLLMVAALAGCCAAWLAGGNLRAETTATTPPGAAAIILTPRPAPQPHINVPKIYGCRPGHPFLYRIPATGGRPMHFGADSLPGGLKLDADTGIITGTLAQRGEYSVTLRALNQYGGAVRSFKIVCGDTLALTPPMGWNDWYAHYARITDPMVRAAADLMVTNGMADAGYQYVNIDDCWGTIPEESKRKNKDALRTGSGRDEQGNLRPNQYFPDMKGLTDYIHAKGLKAGVYTSPGPLTCAGFAGSYQHEAQDARQFADWGFDFLKYDWCSYGGVVKGERKDRMILKKPYQLMGDALKQQPRDLVFNLCQYGMGNVWEWGAEVGGQSWRTGGDLGLELSRMFAVALKNASYRDWQKPGAWNDPDYIQIGYIGNAHGGGQPEPCSFSPAEQYSFMSLWCLMSSPLFYSGDLTRLDDFTLNILCNSEVIEIDQDSLGQCAKAIMLDRDTFIMVKELEDGSKALGFCNAGEGEATVTAKWAVVDLHGQQLVHDLWRQKDLGTYQDEFKATVPRHGVVLVKVSASR